MTYEFLSLTSHSHLCDMELLRHFEEENKNIVVLTLKDDEWDEFVNKLPAEYKKCYISSEELNSRIKNFSSSKEQELSEILPTIGNIKSGDFGEILAYFLFKERHKVDGPKKWKWKEEQNVAAPYTDVILFSKIEASKPSKNDLIISVESKMKATKSNSYHPLQKAIDGAEKDYVSRIANSLSWLRSKYKKENAPTPEIIELVNMIERFIKSETFGEYTKQLKAVAFVDKNFLDDELKKGFTIPPKISGADLEIMAVSVKDLKTAYEKVFTEIPKL